MDKWLIDQFDRVALWAQRRGYLLTEIQVHIAGFGVAATGAYSWHRDSYALFGFCLLVWGSIFISRILHAQRYRDYPSSVRMIERLNAQVLEEREEAVPIWCRLGLLVCGVLQLPDFVVKLMDSDFTTAVLALLGGAAPILVAYSTTCFYIGPGEFSKKKQEVTTGQEIFDRGA